MYRYSRTYIFVRILLPNVLLVVLEVFALDLIVVDLTFDFFFIVDFLDRLGLALLGFRSCSHSRQ